MAFLTSTAAALFGTANNDTLNTLGGFGPTAYTLVSGGLGNDIYFIDAYSVTGLDSNLDLVIDALDYFYADIVNETANGGIDTIELTLSTQAAGTFGNINDFTLFDNVENLSISASGDAHTFNINGNSSANKIVFNGASNLLANIDGGAGNDTITGGIGNDTLRGGTGNDSLIGGDGDDTYYVDSLSDVVVESLNAGADFVYSSVSFTLANNVEALLLTGNGNLNGTGNALDNALFGNSGNNTLSGLAGNDSISGLDGNDTLLGGDGDDNLFGGYGNDSLNGGNGNDILNGVSGSNILRGGAGNDTLTGGAGNHNLDGNDGSDLYNIYGNGSVTIADTGATGVDVISTLVQLTGDLAAGVEELGLVYNALGGTAVIGRGNALNNGILGNEYNNTLFGLAGDDALAGVLGDDLLDGGTGKDTLDGGIGNDLMRGGDGNDTYFVDNALDVVIETNATLAIGGVDTIYSSFNFGLSNNVENLTLVGAATNGYGNSGNNVLMGNNSNNILSGYAGNDTLNGGLGADVMAGGDGNDIYYVDSVSDSLDESLSNGIDTVFSTVTFTMATQAYGAIENVTLLGSGNFNIYGSFSADKLTGNSGDNYLAGYNGNDTLIGGLGNDFLYGGLGIDSIVGGAGNDFYSIDASDIIVEAANQGIDEVLTDATFSLAPHVNIENLGLLGSANINGTGNGLNNTITGNTGNNRLDGSAGNDTLNGQGGIDTLIGGAGNDFIYFTGGATVEELAGGGIDTLSSNSFSTINLNVGQFANIENVILTGYNNVGIIGNAANNKLTGDGTSNNISGGDGNDTLDGGFSGVDLLEGGAGNDVYLISHASISVIDSAGIDKIISSVDFNLDVNLENITFTGASDAIGYGNALANMMIGNEGNNALRGFGGNDTLIGGLGNDILNGDAGNDSMAGGLGNDTYYVDSTTDKVIELLGQGSDTVFSAITFNLAISGANIENVTLIEGANSNAIGNALNNVLSGYGFGNNLLSGGLGDDTLLAGEGNDTLTGGVGNDAFGLISSIGLDTITDFTVGVDSLIFAGLAGLVFDGAGGSLRASQFHLGTELSAADADDFIIYDQASGNLYYDINGNIAGGTVQIFDFVGPSVALSSADIFDGSA